MYLEIAVRTKALVLVMFFGTLPFSLPAQVATARPPVIDVHMHAPISPGPVESFLPDLESWIAEMDRLNVRLSVLSGLPDVLASWQERTGDRAIPSLLFPCENGVAVNWGRPCFEDGGDWPDITQLRADVESGRIQALGEVTTQYLGLGPSDPLLEPYFALAEEYDLPVFIHMGPGPPFSAYEENPFRIGAPNYRATAGNPLLLEEALLRHPRVRVAVMHAGWPLADEMVFMLYQHPQVYAELGLLQWVNVFPRAEYYSFLRRLVEAGFADRILFGSDTILEEGIAAILEAEFLTDEQKEAILCKNAARFLRLGEEICTQ
jgi:hypothetical protein